MINNTGVQSIIDNIVALSFSTAQWHELARKFDLNPLDVYAEKTTNPEKAESIVNRVQQVDDIQKLPVFAREISEFKVGIHQADKNLSKLDTLVSLKFGNLYKELLEKIELDSITKPNGELDNKRLFDTKESEFIDFKEKLTKIAKFSESNRRLGIESKNDNSVLKRKAKKLGFNDYEDIIERIRTIYNNRILTNYPPDKNNSDIRLREMLNELFEYLPAEFQEDDLAIGNLYGMIFDTTSKCFIFNE